VSDHSVDAGLALSSSSGVVRQIPISVAPGHTERLNVRDLLGSVLNGMGGLSVTYAKGALSAAQIVFDDTTGFAAIMKLFERDLGEIPTNHILRAPMMALSQPDPVLAFPQGTKLIPQILLWNAGTKAVAVSPIIDWKDGSASGRFQHPVIELSPYQSKIIYLDDFQLTQQIPSTAMWSTVTLSYIGTRADVVAVALAYDQTNRYGLQTPFSEGTSRLWKGSMWHVDGNHNTIITTGNGGSEPTTAQVTLFYNDSQDGYKIKKVLSPGEQLWLDVGQLIRGQVPDSDGRTLPPDIMMGSYELRDMDHQTVGLLYEGKLVIDKTFGHASYGCAACCGYNTTAMSPSSFIGPPSVYNQDVIQAFDGCTGEYDDVTTGGYNWSSANTSVATISQTGNLHTVSVGSTSDNTFVQLQSDIVSHNCPEVTKNPTQQLTVRKPNHLQVVVDSTGELTACPSTNIRQITYQVVDVSNNPVNDLVSVREQFSNKSANSCNTTVHTTETCTVIGGGSFTDALTVGCNSVGGTCGFTYTHQQWLWCSSTGVVIATPGDLVVHNNAITVGGSIYFAPGTYIYP